MIDHDKAIAIMCRLGKEALDCDSDYFREIGESMLYCADMADAAREAKDKLATLRDCFERMVPCPDGETDNAAILQLGIDLSAAKNVARELAEALRKLDALLSWHVMHVQPSTERQAIHMIIAYGRAALEKLPKDTA